MAKTTFWKKVEKNHTKGKIQKYLNIIIKIKKIIIYNVIINLSR
jgi:hypothetical protein